MARTLRQAQRERLLRIDRYLFFVRLLKSRTQAQALIDEGHVRVDGRRIVKPSEEVRVGSVIALPLHGAVRILKVLALPVRRGPASEARTCYEDIGGPADSANVSQERTAD